MAAGSLGTAGSLLATTVSPWAGGALFAGIASLLGVVASLPYWLAWLPNSASPSSALVIVIGTWALGGWAPLSAVGVRCVPIELRCHIDTPVTKAAVSMTVAAANLSASWRTKRRRVAVRRPSCSAACA